MSKFRNSKSNKNQGIHTIFGQHSVRAALQNDKREHIELITKKQHRKKDKQDKKHKTKKQQKKLKL
jgi:tRNA G18 (ribose-2'-O)-methylase SpoU